MRPVLLKFHSQNGFELGRRCSTGDFLDELPNFHIDTFSELEEHSGRFAEVEKFIEGEENANTRKNLLRLQN